MKWLKISLGLLGTIFLGAIGSGLWEYLRRPVEEFFALLAVSLDKLSGTYLDSLHAEIGKAYRDELVLFIGQVFPITIVMLNIVGLLFFISLRRKLRRAVNETNETSRLREQLSTIGLLSLTKFFFLPLLVVIANIVLYSNSLYSATYRIRTITWIERSIEILHPKLDEREFLKLRAQYRSIDSASAYYKLRESLIGHASAHRINLPENDAVGSDLKVPHFSEEENALNLSNDENLKP